LFNLGNISPRTVYSVKDGSNQDIRQVIDRMIPIANKQMSKAAQQFKGKNNKETARNIWNFLKHRIRYQADGSEQIVKAPSALVRTKVGDCKSYAIFTSAVLSNLGIPHKIVYTSYSSNPTPEHVYIQINDGYIIDAVWKAFNSEKKPTFKYTRQMNVKGITGIAGSTGTYRAGTGNAMLGAIGAIAKNNAKRAAAIIPLTPARAAFLALVRLNALGLASVINYAWAKSAYQNQGRPGDSPAKSDTLSMWYNLGGRTDSLNAAIRAGETKKAVGNKFVLWLGKKNVPGIKKYAALLKETIDHYVNKRKIDIREKKKVRGIGAEPASTGLAATITAAMPIILAILPLLAALAGRTPSDREFDDVAKTYGDGTTDTPPADYEPKKTAISAGGLTPLLIAGGLAAALLLTGKKSK